MDDRDRVVYSILTLGAEFAPDGEAQRLLGEMYGDLMCLDITVEVGVVLMMGAIRDGVMLGQWADTTNVRTQEMARREAVDALHRIVTKEDADAYMKDVTTRKDLADHGQDNT